MSETPKGKILVVDDVRVNQKLLSLLLTREGFEVLVAGDGPQAVEIARRERPALVLLDVMLPGQDGISVLADLQGDSRTAGAAVIFLTALGEAMSQEKGLSLGAIDVIQKPFEAAHVIARVEAYFARTEPPVRGET